MAYNYAVRAKFNANGCSDRGGNAWTAVGTPAFDAGRFGGLAPRFSSTFYYSLPANAQPLLNLGVNDFTITFWVRMDVNNSPYATILNGGRYFCYQRLSLSSNYSGVPQFVYGSSTALAAKTSISDAKWHYVTLTRKNLVDRIFVDGKLEGENDASGYDGSTSSGSGAGFKNINLTGRGTGLGTELNGDGNAYFCGLVDDFVVINGTALWTADFTPPPSYLFAPYKLYRVGDVVYGVSSGALTKLTDSWSATAVVDRVTCFKSTNFAEATVDDLRTLSKFTVMELNTSDDSVGTCYVQAVPKRQFVYETVDVDLKQVSNLDWLKVNVGTTNFVTNGGVLRVVVSRDAGVTWWTYSLSNSTWTQLLNTADVNDGSVIDGTFTPSSAGLDRLKSAGLVVDQLSTVPWQAWTIDSGFKQIRVGVYLEVTATTDVAVVDNLQVCYDGLGTWRLAANYNHYTVDTGNFSHKVTWLTPINGKRVKVNY